MPLRSNPLKHCVQVIAQIDECVGGHARLPLGTQPLNHFREPDSCASPAAMSEPL